MIDRIDEENSDNEGDGNANVPLRNNPCDKSLKKLDLTKSRYIHA